MLTLRNNTVQQMISVHYHFVFSHQDIVQNHPKNQLFRQVFQSVNDRSSQALNRQLINAVKQGLFNCSLSRALFNLIAKQSPTVFTYVFIFNVSAQYSQSFICISVNSRAFNNEKRQQLKT